MFEKRSKILLVTAILVTIYVIYLIIYFGGSMFSADSLEAIGSAIATALVTPHMIAIGIGAIFSWLGFFFAKILGSISWSYTLLYRSPVIFNLCYVLHAFSNSRIYRICQPKKKLTKVS